VLPPSGGPPSLPPGTLPYPQISPFEHRFSEHGIENGLWMHDVNDSPRRYYGGVTAMALRVRKPERALVGNPKFAFLLAVSQNAPVTIGQPYNGTHIFDKNFKTEGIRLHWGFVDADDTGMEFVAWWATDVTQQFKIGQDADASDPATTVQFAPGIPVENGSGGDVLLFDRMYRIRYSQEAINLQFERGMTAIWKSSGIKIRPVWGIKYLFLRERMMWDGVGGGNLGGFPPLFSGFMNTSIRSHMVGPQLGLRGEFGGDSFKIVAGSRFIIFGNIERLRLEGDNYGNPFQVALGNINSFSQTIRNSHLSPAYEFTIHGEAKVLQFVPLLNRYDFFKEASLRVGFTLFNVAEVARPGRSVRHNGLPMTPELITDRSKWSYTAWDFGLSFKY
jgi:hypothetical protein